MISKRTKHRISLALYRPRKSRGFGARAGSLQEIDKKLEKKIDAVFEKLGYKRAKEEEDK